MSRSVKEEMHRIQRRFVAQITALAHRVAVETVTEAFVGPSVRICDRATGVASPRDGNSGPARPDDVQVVQVRRRQGAKRTPAELEALSGRFAAFVQANSGLRIEQINKLLGTTTTELELPIRKLIADGIIHTKGHKRSTTYFGNQHAQA